MKKLIVSGVILVLLASLLVVGCGIPQETYDTVVAERDAFANDVEGLEGARDQLRADYAELEAEGIALNAQVDELQGEVGVRDVELSRNDTEIEVLKGRLAEMYPYGLILENHFFCPISVFSTPDLIEITNLVDDIGNEVLIEAWENWVDTGSDEDGEFFWFAVWAGLWDNIENYPHENDYQEN